MKRTGKGTAVGWALSIALVLFATLFTVSFSIGIPIYLRPFYYAQIGPLGIEDATGLSREEIIAGYDEVLDYLTRPGGEFSAGEFAYSAEGKAHFEDCKVLFTLNATVYVISAAALIIIFLIKKRFSITFPRLFGFIWSRAAQHHANLYACLQRRH